VAETVDRVLVAGRVLGDPLLACAVAKHAETMILQEGILGAAGLERAVL